MSLRQYVCNVSDTTSYRKGAGQRDWQNLVSEYNYVKELSLRQHTRITYTPFSQLYTRGFTTCDEIDFVVFWKLSEFESFDQILLMDYKKICR